MTVSDAVKEDVLDALGNATSFSLGAVWLKLHTGDPGSAGTANAASHTTRQQASFALASGATIVSDAGVTWGPFGSSETITHFSAWSASTAGTWWFNGLLTRSVVPSGSSLSVASGGLSLAWANNPLGFIVDLVDLALVTVSNGDVSETLDQDVHSISDSPTVSLI